MRIWRWQKEEYREAHIIMREGFALFAPASWWAWISTTVRPHAVPKGGRRDMEIVQALRAGFPDAKITRVQNSANPGSWNTLA